MVDGFVEAKLPLLRVERRVEMTYVVDSTRLPREKCKSENQKEDEWRLRLMRPSGDDVSVKTQAPSMKTRNVARLKWSENLRGQNRTIMVSVNMTTMVVKTSISNNKSSLLIDVFLLSL
jgi:hypothetical protein